MTRLIYISKSQRIIGMIACSAFAILSNYVDIKWGCLQEIHVVPRRNVLGVIKSKLGRRVMLAVWSTAWAHKSRAKRPHSRLPTEAQKLEIIIVFFLRFPFVFINHVCMRANSHCQATFSCFTQNNLPPYFTFIYFFWFWKVFQSKKARTYATFGRRQKKLRDTEDTCGWGSKTCKIVDTNFLHSVILVILL